MPAEVPRRAFVLLVCNDDLYHSLPAYAQHGFRRTRCFCVCHTVKTTDLLILLCPIRAARLLSDEAVQVEAGAMIANCGVDLETKSGGKTFFESLGRMFGMVPHISTA